MSKPNDVDDIRESLEDDSRYVAAPVIYIEESISSFLKAKPENYEYVANVVIRRFNEHDLEKINNYLRQAADDLHADMMNEDGVNEAQLNAQLRALENVIERIEVETKDN